MIYSYEIEDSIDKIFESNMFLKDEEAIKHLKGSIYDTCVETQNQLDTIMHEVASTNSQVYTNVEEMEKIRKAITQYFKDNIDASRRALSILDEYYY